MTEQYPRVAVLTYRILADDHYDYPRSAKLDGELRGFRFELRHHKAAFVPLERIRSEDEARALLEPQLRAWTLDAALRHGPGSLRFEFVASHVQKAAPPPGVVEATGHALLSIRGLKMNIIQGFATHPGPPQDFAVDEYVQILGELFLLARGTPKTVLYMAYSMTTCLEEYFGGLAGASKRLAISKPVLETVERLSNSRGTGVEARKFNAGKRDPLTAAEREWLLLRMETIVRRAGAAAAGAPVGKTITLGEVPLPT